MYISHLLIQNVRGIEALDLALNDDWHGDSPEAVLFVGPNGSGKTTLLNAIAQLWQVLGEFIQIETKISTSNLALTLFPFLGDGGASIQISNWLGQTAYVCAGRYGWVQQALAEAHTASLADFYVGIADVASSSGEYWFADRAHPPVSWHGGHDHVASWLRLFADKLLRNTLGKDVDLPNIVYFPSERRYLNVGSYEPKPESDAFEWFYTYDAGKVANGGLQNYLFNLKVIDPAAFDRAITQLNKFWHAKQIDGFDPRTRQLMVKTESGARHPINDLSSGEKQVLLMLSHIAQRLRPGGILIIDEPDLHLHPALSTAFVSHLRRMVKDHSGQLILASHSPDLRQLFASNELIYLGERDEVTA